jgi:DNA-binding XRE family transcriptional regulator
VVAALWAALVLLLVVAAALWAWSRREPPGRRAFASELLLALVAGVAVGSLQAGRGRPSASEGRATMSLGAHLRRLREAAGLSRAGLARKAAVPVSTLRNWEAGRGFPGLPASLRLADALGVPVERLAEGADDPAEE